MSTVVTAGEQRAMVSLGVGESVVVSGDFVRTGGMDMANFALASYLARLGTRLHLVAHRVSPELVRLPNVIVHTVPKPGGSYLFGAPLLDWMGRGVAARVAKGGGRVLVNGGNCRWGDVSWVHYLHAAWDSGASSRGLRRLKDVISRRLYVRSEQRGLREARVVIGNSGRTRLDVVERIGVPPARVRPIYYGIDAERFRPVTANER